QGRRGRRPEHSRYAGGQRAEAQHLSAICHGSSTGSAGDRRRASPQRVQAITPTGRRSRRGGRANAS
ncbi:hypothetical protein AB0C29_48855, partial [Actinoplanes sp. NPDC048791]|uniref:hypothetical protein n=1 Tax=Actinoplanes sp. NPDC048791 TaxID=3154623 RepID=UPI0033FCD3B5